MTDAAANHHDEHDNAPPGKLRWFQFRLRTLLLVPTVLAGLLVAWRAYLEPYRRQRETIELVKKLGGRVVTAESPNSLRRLCGDDCQNVILVDLADRDDPAEYLDAVVILPFLETLVVGGPGFGDEQARRLHSVRTLTGLVLDSTEVTADGVTELRGISPTLEVYRSQRRAIHAFLHGSHRSIMIPVSKSFPPVGFSNELKSRAGFQYFDEAESVALGNQDLRIEITDDERMRHVRHLATLEGLTVENTHVTDAGLVHVAGLARLQRLNLRDTHVTDAGLTHLRSLTILKSLMLDRTEITDSGLALLKDLPNLTHLYIKDAKVTPRAVAEFKKARPDCAVSY